MQRTALVTGGSKGLGKAIAIELQARGYRVALVDHGTTDAARGFTAATPIPVFDWDIADFDACSKGIAAVERSIGAIDILVNYAGRTPGAAPQRWEQAINASLGAMLNMSRNVIDGMRSRGFGRIVNIGPLIAPPIGPLDLQSAAPWQTQRQAAKTDILALTRSLALTAARDHVTVNAITPGCCEDAPAIAAAPEALQAIPVGRAGTPQDISRIVAFLVDDDAGFITGTSVDVDGGLYLAPELNQASGSNVPPLLDQGVGEPAEADIGLDWSSQMALGAPDIDQAHQAFIAQLAQLLSASDDAFERGLYALIVAMESDFRQEEALMEAIDFPGIRMHREQHARVLSALHHVVPQVMQGDHAQARRVVELIPQWFLFHLTTMDAAMVVALELAGMQAPAAANS
jgi:acetoacetyl-CoA reductase